MKKSYILLIAILISVFQLKAQEDWASNRADGHAPIGVMGDHTHNKGEFMISYRYMNMQMDGMRSGTDDLTSEQVHNNFMVAPLEMPMHMHMIGLMYAVSNKLTIAAMGNVLSSSMDHISRIGGGFTTESGGFGDLRITGLYKIIDKSRQRLHLNIGVSLPTGSIDEMDNTPASTPNESQLPYPMQVGSGTFDLMPGFTYMGQAEKISWGGQLTTILRTGENNRSYTLGNEMILTGWFAYKIQDWVSLSTRFEYFGRGEISGADPTFMNLMMVPTVVPSNFGSTMINGSLGANFYINKGVLKNIRIGAEYEIPLVQDLNGIQLQTTSVTTLGIQYSF